MAKTSRKQKKSQTLDLPFGVTATVVQLPIVPLAKGKSQQDRVPPMSLKGEEKRARAIRERSAAMKRLMAEQKPDEEALIEVARKARLVAEKAGSFHKTVEVAVEGDDGKPLLVLFKDSFSDVDLKHEKALREALGSQFDGLFRCEVRLKEKEPVTVDMLARTLGEKYHDFLGLFDVTEVLALREKTPFMETRATLRRELSADLNEALDAIVERVQAKPTIVKG